MAPTVAAKCNKSCKPFNPWTDIRTDISTFTLKQLTPSMLLSKHLKKKL